MNKKYCEKEEKKTSTEMTDWTERENEENIQREKYKKNSWILIGSA